MGPGDTKWDQIAPDGTTWDQKTIWDQIGPDGTTWDHMGPDGARWDQVGPDGTRWDQMGPDGTRWDQTSDVDPWLRIRFVRKEAPGGARRYREAPGARWEFTVYLQYE